MNQVNQTSTAISSPVPIGKTNKGALSQGGILSFIWNEKAIRRYLWITLIGSSIQFIIFKILYPFPDFISDSYSYIYTAATHANVGLWPIGYSKFLWLIHSIWYNDV